MLQVVQRRLAEQLATSGDVLQAEQAQKAAEVHVKSLEEMGVAPQARAVTAPEAALVSRVDVSRGALVPAGSPLLELVPEGAIEIDLGIQPGDVDLLAPGLLIPLSAVSNERAGTVTGTLRLVSRRRNPDTGLFDVFVALPGDAGLFLNEFVSGSVPLHSKECLVVPRAAILPKEEGFVLFTVEEDVAKEHSVAVMLENDAFAGVSGDGLKEGDRVVVSGNYELRDGMAVKEQPAP